MKFDEVLKDLAAHCVDEANGKFLIQHASHDFKPFTCERQVMTDGGSTFRVKIEFEPDPVEALMRAVARN